MESKFKKMRIQISDAQIEQRFQKLPSKMTRRFEWQLPITAFFTVLVMFFVFTMPSLEQKSSTATPIGYDKGYFVSKIVDTPPASIWQLGVGQLSTNTLEKIEELTSQMEIYEQKRIHDHASPVGSLTLISNERQTFYHMYRGVNVLYFEDVTSNQRFVLADGIALLQDDLLSPPLLSWKNLMKFLPLFFALMYMMSIEKKYMVDPETGGKRAQFGRSWLTTAFLLGMFALMMLTFNLVMIPIWFVWGSVTLFYSGLLLMDRRYTGFHYRIYHHIATYVYILLLLFVLQTVVY